MIIRKTQEKGRVNIEDLNMLYNIQFNICYIYIMYNAYLK